MPTMSAIRGRKKKAPRVAHGVFSRLLPPPVETAITECVISRPYFLRIALWAALCVMGSCAWFQPRQAFADDNAESPIPMVNPANLEDGVLKQQFDALSGEARERAIQNLSAEPLSNLPWLQLDSSGSIMRPDPPGEPPPAPLLKTPLDTSAVRSKSALAPLGSTFLLHSRSNSTHKIFLDFDGHTTVGTWHNVQYNGGAPIYSSAFDPAGNGAPFNDDEKEIIQYIWQRAAEDFAPFDVDVTTQEPPLDDLRKTSADDNAFGMRVVISPSYQWFGPYGGFAYFDSFSWNSDTPCFVFSCFLYTIEQWAGCVSHELGHTLGMPDQSGSGGYYSGHDSPAGGWAPLMGTSYYRPITHWTKGEYYDARTTDDNLARLSAVVGYIPDDHGNTCETATMLATSDVVTVSGGGLVERTEDPDFFSFQCGEGSIHLEFRPSGAGGDPGDGSNLDIIARLFDENGALVFTSDNSTSLYTCIDYEVTRGTWYVSVSGTGSGSPLANPPTGYTSYGSLGPYTIAGTVPEYVLSTPSISNGPGATNLFAVRPGVALRGFLSGSSARVYMYWGTADGGTNRDAWANVIHLGVRIPGLLSTNVYSFLYGQRYYYRCYASNMVDTAWAPASTNFLLARPPDPQLPVSGGLSLWLNASQAGSLTNGQQVVKWPDLSGNGRDAVRDPASTAGYPQYRTNQVNGLPAVQFSIDSGSWFDFNNMTNIRTVFWTLRERMPGVNSLLGDETATCFKRGTTTNYSIWNDSDASPNVLNGTTRLMGNVVDGEATKLGSGYQLVSLVTTGNVEADRISQDRTHVDRSWDGEIAEIAVYDRALTAEEEYDVGSYLTEKYGLTTTAYAVTGPRTCGISNVIASGVTATSVVLNARLKGTNSFFQVRAYWGTSDGGTNPAAWTGSALAGGYSNAASADISLQVSGLATNIIYYFRFCASNLAENLWSTPAFPFSCPLMTKTIAATAATGGSIVPSGAVLVNIGHAQAFSVVPAVGYCINNVLVDGISQGPVPSYCFSNVSTNHSIAASFAVITNSIEATAVGNGSISPSGTVKVAYGASQSFNVASNAGYRIADVLVDGISVGAPASYTFTNVTAGHSISAVFAIVTNDIIASAGPNGTISPFGTIKVQSGLSMTFIMAGISSGFRVADVLIDGISVGAPGSYSFTNVFCDHTISVSFAVVTNTITATAGPGGGISPSGAVMVVYGNAQVFSMTSNTGYRVWNVIVDGVSRGAMTSFPFNNVTADHTISAQFAVITNSILASAGPGGTIVPEGDVKVAYGASRSFNISSNIGSRLTNVVVDGVPRGIITSYTFTNVTASHTISALYQSDMFTITATATGGGSISPSGQVGVAHGTSQTFGLVPDTGCRIVNVIADGVSQGAVSQYTFVNVTNTHSISAVFGMLTNIITATAGPGGSISPSGAVSAAYSDTVRFTIASNTGYRLVDVMVDGMSVGIVTSYSFHNVLSPCSIVASFSLITNTITATASPVSGGSIVPGGVVSIGYGASQTFNIFTNAGYCLSNVVVDGVSMGAITSYQFTNVSGNRSITAQFMSSSSAVRYDGDGTVSAWCELQRWLINRARFNPEAEADRLGLVNSSTGGHPAYDACEDTAGTNDFGAGSAEWAQWTASKQPLALNARMNSAASNHCVDLAGIGVPQYATPGGSARYTPGWTCVQRQALEGYTNSLGGWLENVACNGSWDVDSDYPVSGPPAEVWQDGAFLASHDEARAERRGILSVDAREIGIGYVRADIFGSICEFCAEDYGKHGSDRFFTDTIFHDADADNVYDVGEGIGGVEIRLYDGGIEAGWYDLSAAAGSFAVPTTALVAGHRIDVVLVNKSGSAKVITIPSGYATSVNINLDDGQSASVGSYVQGSLNTGFRNLETTIVDGDTDGMYDSWEQRYFVTTNSANGGPGDDWDGDGLSNLQEYWAGTDPTNPASALVVGIAWSNSAVRVRVNTVLASPTDYGAASRHYGMEQASDLSASWSNVAGYADFQASGQPAVFTNSTPALRSFYRVKAWLVQ